MVMLLSQILEKKLEEMVKRLDLKNVMMEISLIMMVEMLIVKLKQITFVLEEISQILMSENLSEVMALLYLQETLKNIEMIIIQFQGMDEVLHEQWKLCGFEKEVMNFKKVPETSEY